MFILDITNKDMDHIPRLTRLMHNIESGVQTFDWDIKNDGTPYTHPEKDFLSIKVPSINKNAPSYEYSFRPSTGFIFYLDGIDVDELISKIWTQIDILPDDHLISKFLSVECTSHVMLLHKNHVKDESLVQKSKKSRIKKSKSKYKRIFHNLTNLDQISKHQSHISHFAAFTWYFTPIISISTIDEIYNSSIFNMIFSSIFLDSHLGGNESIKPLYSLEYEKIFNLPLPEIDIISMLKKHKNFIMYVNGEIHPVGQALYNTITSWRYPFSDHTEDIKNINIYNINLLDSPDIKNLCGICKMPLWGEIIAIENKSYYMAVCIMCAGCIDKKLLITAIKTYIPKTIIEAYRENPNYSYLVPLLESSVKRYIITDKRSTREKIALLITPKSGKNKYFIISNPKTKFSGFDTTISNTVPLCVRYSKFKDYLYPTVYYDKILIHNPQNIWNF